MVTLASATIRGVATTVAAPDIEIANPTAGSVASQVVTLDPGATVTLNTTDDAFQVLSDGTVAFVTDLATATTKQINVLDVLTNQYPVTSPVEVTEDTDTFTMSNEYYTVTLRKTQNLASPLMTVASIVPATGTVQLTSDANCPDWSSAFDSAVRRIPTISAHTFDVIEQGPLVVKVKATFTFSHSDYSYGGMLVYPAASAAVCSETIELRAGVNAVFFEAYAEYNWMNKFDIVNLDMDQLLYRGHSATNIAYGYVTVTGTPQTYTIGTHHNNTAYRDVASPMLVTDYSTYGFVPAWNRWVPNQGRFSIARDSSGTNDQYVAIMGGAASRALGTSISGVMFTGNSTSTKLTFSANGRTPAAQLSRPTRYAWALAICDEPAPADGSETVPEAGLIQNQHILFPLSKFLAWKPASESETFYTTALYMPADQQEALFDLINSNTSYANGLIVKDSTATDLINYLKNPTLANAEVLYDALVADYETMLNAWWFMNGYFDKTYSYWSAGLEILRNITSLPLLMQDTNLTADQKAEVYRIMLFFGRLMADGDFVPSENYTQFNMGTANMPLQYFNQMDSLHLQLLSNPDIAEYFDIADFPTRLRARLEAYINSDGSSIGSPHYTSPGTVPTMNLIQQGYVAGLIDFAATESRLALFGEFLMAILTPEDSRFGNRRKMIAFGDSSLEGTEMHGQLGTIFASENPTLSARLMEAWDSMGARHDGFYQTSIFKIDDNLPRQSMALTDTHFPVYMSAFRSGFDTSNESAVWFLHGEGYSDHRHFDSGAVYCYLLGKPIALDWSSFASPYISGSIMHNGLTILDGSSWDGTGGLVPAENPGASNYNILEGSGFFDLSAITYTPSSTRPTTQATFDLDASTTWTRTVMLNKEEVARPVVVIEDTFAGTNAADEKILSLNIMASGAVSTPDGDTTPSTTANRATSTDKTALASGWTTFEFTGQWGVNVILMVYNAASANYQLGRFSHTYSPAVDKAEYLAAVGSAYVEMQYQFRLWSTDDSMFVLVPWLASGSKPTVTTSGMDVLVDGDTVT